MTNAKQPNYLGDYCALVRVNGRRTCIGSGHTYLEAQIHALDACAEAYPHDSHIYALLKARSSHALQVAV